MAKEMIRGALFRHTPKQNEDPNKEHPVYDITLEVMGVRLRLAAWPQTQAKASGVKYMPISGDYALTERKRLVDVTPVIGAAQQGGAASPAPAAAPTPAPAADEDLPF